MPKLSAVGAGDATVAPVGNFLSKFEQTWQIWAKLRQNLDKFGRNSGKSD